MNSTDFKTSLFDVPVTIEGNKKKGEKDRTMTYYDYLCKEQKKPWWSSAIGGTTKAIKSLFSTPKPEEEETLDPFRLTKKQAGVAKALNSRVVCDVDKKTMVITISVTDQNPVICATMADTVKNRLQKFITDYRTSKARVDLKYNQKLYGEAKARYDKARRLYADFVDSNQDIILESVRQRQTELENDMQLQYNAYVSYSSYLQGAEARVQQDTPAFMTLQNATVPLKPSGPSKKKIVLVFFFLAIMGTTTYILHKENELLPMLGLSE